MDSRSPKSITAYTFVRTHTQTHFWAIHTHARLPHPGTYPRCSTLGHDQQCAMRAARFIRGFWKGLFTPWRQFQGVHPACLRMLKGRSVLLDLGEGRREGWSFASPGWWLCRMGQSIVSHDGGWGNRHGTRVAMSINSRRLQMHSSTFPLIYIQIIKIRILLQTLIFLIKFYKIYIYKLWSYNILMCIFTFIQNMSFFIKTWFANEFLLNLIYSERIENIL